MRVAVICFLGILAIGLISKADFTGPLGPLTGYSSGILTATCPDYDDSNNIVISWKNPTAMATKSKDSFDSLCMAFRIIKNNNLPVESLVKTLSETNPWAYIYYTVIEDNDGSPLILIDSIFLNDVLPSQKISTGHQEFAQESDPNDQKNGPNP